MRRELDLAITEGRDTGRTYHLKEMSASQAEKWAARALLALLKSGAEIPEDAAQAGLAGLATAGIKAFSGIPWDLAEPLLDEMMTCVTVKLTLPGGTIHTRELVEEDIEDVATRLRIRKELLELHLGFSIAAKLSNLTASAAVEPGGKTL